MTIPIYTSEDLRFSELISLLSSGSNLPSSIKVRNRLLSPWTISSPPQDWTFNSNTPNTDPDPWSTLLQSTKGLEVYLFGNVPEEILVEGSEKAVISVWAVALLSPPLHEDHKSHAPRLDLWLSSEGQVISGTLDSCLPDASRITNVLEEEEVLLSFVLKSWLPSRLSHGKKERSSGPASTEENHGTEGVLVYEGNSVVLCGLEHRLLERVKGWKEQTLRIEWINSCLVYMKGYNLEREMIGEDLIDRRWKIGKIEEADIDLVSDPSISLFNFRFSRSRPNLKLTALKYLNGRRYPLQKHLTEDLLLRIRPSQQVQRSNKLPFPTEYIRKHLAHSV